MKKYHFDLHFTCRACLVRRTFFFWNWVVPILVFLVLLIGVLTSENRLLALLGLALGTYATWTAGMMLCRWIQRTRDLNGPDPSGMIYLFLAPVAIVYGMFGEALREYARTRTLLQTARSGPLGGG